MTEKRSELGILLLCSVDIYNWIGNKILDKYKFSQVLVHMLNLLNRLARFIIYIVG